MMAAARGMGSGEERERGRERGRETEGERLPYESDGDARRPF